MGVSFLHPLYLLALPVCLAVTVFLSRKYLPGGFNRALFTALRCVVAALLALALAGTSLVNYADVTTNIFAIDVSASMEGTAGAALGFIREAQASRGAKDSVGVVCFGENAVVDSMPSLTNAPTGISSFVDTGFTNIAEGLRLARAVMPENTKKHVILLSDGQENMGDALAQARLLGERGVAVSVLPVQNTVTREAQLSELKTPKSMKKDSRYDIEVTGHALSQTAGRLLVYKNSALIADERVTMRPGENKFVFSDTADESGGVIYRAEILPDDDTFTQNNTAHAYSYVEGPPGALLLDDGAEGEQIAQILLGSGVNVTRLSPEAAPASLEQLSRYDAVILANVPLDAMPEAFPALLESYVKDTGGGLLVTGGDSSYALGGYKDSPLETALPVGMELKDKENAPNLGMIVVVDRSGSMGVGQYGISKLELAKEAVIRSLETMNDKDSLGVIAFDDSYYWAGYFRLVGGNRESITTDVANIQLGGGTSILPGLSAACDAITAADTKLKHIVLLTDGMAERSGYDNVLDKMAANGITLSTVAVGGDSDTNLLRRLAKSAGGRYYYSDEFSDLPKIFARETYLAGKTFLNNEIFTPAVISAGQLLAGVSAMPALGGYVSTTAKDRADTVLASHKDEPVLAAWQFGLGRSAAWTSDMAGMWSAGWLASAEGPAIFRNTLSWVARKQAQAGVSLSAALEGDSTVFYADIPYDEGVLGITAAITAPDGTVRDVAFRATAPGRYKAVLDGASGEGAYIVNMAVETPGGAERLNTGVSIPYSAEYDIRAFGKGENLLKRIAEAAGGRVIATPAEVYAAKPAAAHGQTDISNALLAAGLLLFLLDIFIRRFPAVARALERRFRQAGELFGRLAAPRKAAGPALIRPATGEETAPAVPRNEPAAPPKDPVARNPGGTSGALVSRKKKRMNR